MMREVHLRGLNKDIHLWQVQGFLDSAVTPKSIHFFDTSGNTKTATFLVQEHQLAALLAPAFRAKLQQNGMTIFVPYPAAGSSTRASTAASDSWSVYAPNKTITIPAPEPPTTQPSDIDTNDKPRNLYFTGLPKALTQDQFRLLAEKWGTVEHSMLLSVLDGQGRRRGFVIYDEHAVAKKALTELNGAKISGHTIDVSWAMVQRYSKTGPTTHRDNTIPNRLEHPPARQTMTEIQVELPATSSVPTSETDAPLPMSNATPQTHMHAAAASNVAITNLQKMVEDMTIAAQAPINRHSNVLLLENLPAVITTDYGLGHLFKQWGEIKKCMLFPPQPKINLLVATGYLEYTTYASAQLCLEACHGLPLGGNILAVRFLTEREASTLGWGEDPPTQHVVQMPTPMPMPIPAHVQPQFRKTAPISAPSWAAADTSYGSSSSHSRNPWHGWAIDEDETSPESSWEAVEKKQAPEIKTADNEAKVRERRDD